MDTPPEQGSQDKRWPRVIDRSAVASYRDAVRDQWIQARRDLSSTYTNLAAGGVALLVTLLSTVGLPSLWAAVLYAGALSGFIRTIYLRTRSLQWDSEYLKLAWEDAEVLTEDKKMEEMETEGRELDRGLARWFWIGVACAVLIGGWAAVDPLVP